MEKKALLLQALETEKAGDWDAARRIVQKMEDSTAYWIHAYPLPTTCFLMLARRRGFSFGNQT